MAVAIAGCPTTPRHWQQQHVRHTLSLDDTTGEQANYIEEVFDLQSSLQKGDLCNVQRVDSIKSLKVVSLPICLHELKPLAPFDGFSLVL